MSSFYHNVVGPKLQAQLDAVLAQPHETQLQLYEELAIARLAASRALAMAQPVLDGSVTDTKTLRIALPLIKDALSHVSDLVSKASSIEAQAKDKFSVKIVALFVMQLTHAIYDELGDEHKELAERLVRRIDERVKLPAPGRKMLNASTEFNDFGALIARINETTSPVGLQSDEDDAPEEMVADEAAPDSTCSMD